MSDERTSRTNNMTLSVECYEPSNEAAEQRLLSRALDGDQEAWNAFYQRYCRVVSCAVVRVLRRYLPVFTESDVADFTAEVWVALLSENRRKLRLYDPHRCRLSTWLKLLATNCTIDQLRVGDRGPRRTVDDEVLCLVADEQPQADEQVAVKEQAELARRALDLLRAKDRNFVVRYLTDGRETRQIARELGISIHTIHSRKFKIRQKLVRLVRRIERDSLRAVA